MDDLLEFKAIDEGSFGEGIDYDWSCSFEFFNSKMKINISEPYLATYKKWKDFLLSIKKSEKYYLELGWVYLYTIDGNVEFHIDTRSGAGGEGDCTLFFDKNDVLPSIEKAVEYINNLEEKKKETFKYYQ